MKLACADFAFPLLPHDRVLELIAMLEFDGVDLGLFEGRSHLWPSREFARPHRAARRLRRRLDAAGLRAADVFLQMAPDFTPLAINHPEAARRSQARDWFVRTLAYAVDCGAGHVTVLPGVYFGTESRATSWGRACDELAWRLEQAARHQVVFSVEAHVGSVAPSPAAAARLVRSVPGLTLTLDYTHFTRRGVPDATIEPLLAHAAHFHARAACRGRLQTCFARNSIDYRRAVDGLRQAGYRGYLGVEYVWTEWERCNEVDNLSETILLRDFLRALA
jgi:sugar phosphate isomerase/epimerase